MVHNMKSDQQNTMNAVPGQMAVLRKYSITFYNVYNQNKAIQQTLQYPRSMCHFLPAFQLSFVKICPQFSVAEMPYPVNV